MLVQRAQLARQEKLAILVQLEPPGLLGLPVLLELVQQVRQELQEILGQQVQLVKPALLVLARQVKLGVLATLARLAQPERQEIPARRGQQVQLEIRVK